MSALEGAFGPDCWYQGGLSNTFVTIAPRPVELPGRDSNERLKALLRFARLPDGERLLTDLAVRHDVIGLLKQANSTGCRCSQPLRRRYRHRLGAACSPAVPTPT